jgi:hypothetical protein
LRAPASARLLRCLRGPGIERRSLRLARPILEEINAPPARPRGDGQMIDAVGKSDGYGLTPANRAPPRALSPSPLRGAENMKTLRCHRVTRRGAVTSVLPGGPGRGSIWGASASPAAGGGRGTRWSAGREGRLFLQGSAGQRRDTGFIPPRDRRRLIAAPRARAPRAPQILPRPGAGSDPKREAAESAPPLITPPLPIYSWIFSIEGDMLESRR